ncbi:DNA-binding CsgD family transcriptional regulator [Chitinivorax tropicus]|uniref:DNA-binding CsgD family transcriptional regulator n=1 Tax=Chitinivorax tropicus TaxID=714531 RepID=A0A840ML45_9PROT|nr:helix-turn-helix transcriptional regulator [Chitinivorax tropicus]MBB5017597.1 DNA-binding CsgD family transcriptional regulator [Chitinivorax tropicus]
MRQPTQVENIDLISVLYESINDPQCLRDFITGFAAGQDQLSAGLLIIQRGHRPQLILEREYPPNDIDDYIDVFMAQDIRLQALLQQSAPVSYDQREYISDDTFTDTAFYRGFLSRTNLFYSAGVRVIHDAETTVLMGAAVPKDKGGVEPHLVERMLYLKPHIERVIRLSQRQHFQTTLNEALCHSLACWNIGIALLDSSASIQFCNGVFESMLSQSVNLRYVAQRLQFRESTLNSRFTSAVSRLARTHQLTGDDHVAYLVTKQSSNLFHQLVLLPLPASVPNGTQGVLAMLSDPDHQRAGRMEIAGQLFGLTPSEKRVAERVLAGQVPSDIASSLTVARSTVVSHLKNLFRKTGTNRQADLMRVLMHVPTCSGGTVHDQAGEQGDGM